MQRRRSYRDPDQRHHKYESHEEGFHRGVSPLVAHVGGTSRTLVDCALTGITTGIGPMERRRPTTATRTRSPWANTEIRTSSTKPPTVLRTMRSATAWASEVEVPISAAARAPSYAEALTALCAYTVRATWIAPNARIISKQIAITASRGA